MIDQFLQSVAWLHNRLPRPWTLAIGRLLGAGLYLALPRRKDVAWANLRRAFPDFSQRQRRAILRRTYQHFCMVFMDFIRMLTITAQRLESVLEFDEANIREAREQGGGAIILSAHIGNWELIASALCLRGYPIIPVIVPQREPGGSFVRAVRESTGCSYIAKRTPTRTMLDLLKEGNFLGLAGDQDAKKRGVWVNLLGQPSSRPRGAAVFALITGAPMLAGWCLLQKNGRYQLGFKSISTKNLPRDRDQAIQVLTQRYTDALGEAIRQHPEQYFWFHRMWKTRLPAS